MRKIKFRAWNGEVMVYGKECPWMAVSFNGGVYRKDTGGGIEIKVPLMQYTGLKDKNGVEIYEGDIVSGPCIGSTIKRSEVVEFNEGGFYPFCIAGWEVTADWRQCEVIGNIYENPELLND